jgi:CBS domain containing-hemolysin-like protein
MMDWVILGSYVGGALFVSATCSLLEAVLMGVNVMKLRAEGGGAAKRMLAVRERFGEASSAILALNTVAHTIGASLAGAQAAYMFGDAWVGVFSGILTILILLLTEIIPKNHGQRNAQRLAGRSSWLLQKVVIPVMKPVVIPSEWLIKRLFGEEEEAVTSEKEVDETILEAGRDDTITKVESDRMRRALMIKGTVIDDLYTPMSHGVKSNMTLRDLAEDQIHSRFSRVVVHGAGSEDITGYVYLKEAFQSVLLGKNEAGCSLDKAVGGGSSGGLLRDVEFCRKGDYASDLLDNMLGSGTQLAVVRDEGGAVIGRVSLEIFWEFLLGVDVRDEDDSAVQSRAQQPRVT